MLYIITTENPFLADIKDYAGTTETDARSAAEWILDHSADKMEKEYDEMLDECYGEIQICGYEYATSIALYRVDETAYRCGLNDYIDGRESDLADEIDRMEDGEEESYYGYTITAKAEEEEEDDK